MTEEEARSRAFEEYFTSEWQRQALEEFITHLRECPFNLMGSSEMQRLWKRHILDCAQLSRFFPDSPQHFLDLGSGGGLPGIILAILFPECGVTLVEARSSKARFLENVSRETILHQRAGKLEVYCGRLDSHNGPKPFPRVDVVTARAVSDASRVFSWLRPHLLAQESSFRVIVPRGASWQQEWRGLAPNSQTETPTDPPSSPPTDPPTDPLTETHKMWENRAYLSRRPSASSRESAIFILDSFPLS